MPQFADDDRHVERVDEVAEDLLGTGVLQCLGHPPPVDRRGREHLLAGEVEAALALEVVDGRALDRPLETAAVDDRRRARSPLMSFLASRKKYLRPSARRYMSIPPIPNAATVPSSSAKRAAAFSRSPSVPSRRMRNCSPSSSISTSWSRFDEPIETLTTSLMGPTSRPGRRPLAARYPLVPCAWPRMFMIAVENVLELGDVDGHVARSGDVPSVMPTTSVPRIFSIVLMRQSLARRTTSRSPAGPRASRAAC